MTHGLNFDISKQFKSQDLQIVSAYLLGADSLIRGAIAYIKINILLAEQVSSFSVRLLIFDTNFQCAFTSSFKSVENASQGQYSINFYFLINLNPGSYVATFEFIRKYELLNDSDESDNLLNRYNSFIEFTINEFIQIGDTSSLGTEQNGYIQQLNTISVYPVSSELPLLKSDGLRHAGVEIPWPQLDEQVSLTDFSTTLKKLSGVADLINSTPTPDMSLLTPNSYERRFLAGQSPMNSKIGVAEGSGLRSDGSAGYLLFGPYLSVLPGRYEVTFECRTGLIDASNTVVFDVVARRGRLLLGKVTPVLPTNQNLSVSLEFEVESPGVVDLELRINVTNGTDVFIESATVKSLLKESARANKKIERIVAACLIGNKDGEKFTHLGSERSNSGNDPKLIVILIPNQVFTICGLILAYHLLKKSNSKTILVSEGGFSKSINTSILSLCGIEKCVLLANIGQELSGVSVDVIITHAENSLRQTKGLLKILSNVNSNVELQAYGDGFRNVANPQKLMAFHSVTRLYFLGVRNFSMQPKADTEVEIVDFQTSQRILTRFAQAQGLVGYEPPGKYRKYSIFCLRYWGLHGYNFPSQLVGENWYRTISAYTPKDELVIIKGGGGHTINNEGYAKLQSLLTENGYSFIDAEDYLISCGMPAGSSDSSLEHLLYSGLFRQVTRFFSLDSSIPIILSQLDYIPRPVEIICGAKDLQDFKLYSGFSVINSNMNQLRKSFANAPFFDPYELIETNQNCFTIKLK